MKILLSFAVLLFSFFSFQTQAAVYSLASNSDLIGSLHVITVERGDTLSKIGKRFGITQHEMIAANRHIKNPNRISVGSTAVIPSFYVLPKYRKGIVINLSELRLYYFDDQNHEVYTYPISVGRAGWRTPTTKTYVYRKKVNPVWNVPKSIKKYMAQTKGIHLPDVVPSGPKNPLGYRALYLARHGYLIHGTNTPRYIGRYISSGCIRMYNKDIEKLYDMVPVKTPVYILHHPDKVGLKDGKLFLEVHEAIRLNESPSKLNRTVTKDVVREAQKDHIYSIDWDKVHQVEKQKQGIPIMISKIRY